MIYDLWYRYKNVNSFAQDPSISIADTLEIQQSDT